MKKILLSLILMFSGTLMAHCSITVGVTMQLLENERNIIPDKTIEESYKEVKFTNKCPLWLQQQLDSTMTVTADNASMWRTFSLKIVPAANDSYNITIMHVDPTADVKSFMGPIIVQHCHFMVEVNEANKSLVNSIFNHKGEKIKYVREFEVVEEKDDSRYTCIEASMSQDTTQVTTCVVDGLNLIEDETEQQ